MAEFAGPSSSCRRYSIPAGVLTFIDDDGVEQTIDTTHILAYYEIGCDSGEIPHFFSAEIPFSWSATPMVFTLSGITTVSWLLMVLLSISKRQRPWLQKLAIVVLSASLTAILSHLASVLKVQYDAGYEDSVSLIQKVLFGLTFRILYVVSLFFLWVAHIQVLVRLFNKQKEKKWIRIISGIITALDVIFWCTSLFCLKKRADHPFGNHHPPAPGPHHDDREMPGYPPLAVNKGMGQYDPMHGPILILATLFDLILHVMYGALVLIYTRRQRRFAYQLEHGVTIALSILSFIAPVGFLILCLAQFKTFIWSSLAALVAGASSTVVVWDWIDVIELGEKREQSHGVMGRPIYEKKLAGEYNKMSGTGGGQGATPGTLRRRTPSRRSLDLAMRSRSTSVNLDPLAQSVRHFWGWSLGLFRGKNSSPGVASQFSDSTGLEMSLPAQSRMAFPQSTSATPIDRNASPQVVFRTTAMELSSPSPDNTEGAAKKFTYPVKRGKIRTQSVAAQDDNGDDDIYDGMEPLQNTIPSEDPIPYEEHETAESSNRAGDVESDDPNRELPHFEMVAGFSAGDYHDDKTFPPQHFT